MNYFERPYALLLIPIILFSIYFFYKTGLHKKKLSIKLSNQISNNQKNIFYYLQNFFPYLRFIALIFFVISFSGPGSEISLLPDEKKGIDIMIAIDVSGSMIRGQDLRPNRLEAAKNFSKEFILKRIHDRIGLAAFAGAAYLQSPLTSDRDTLNEILSDMDNSIIEEQGTAIGDAILLSTNRLKNTSAKSKLLILITDGASNAGKIDPLTAAEIAKQIGIKIYSIGIGKEEQNAYEIDFESLDKISKLTNGIFYRAESSDDLEKIFDSIDSLEKDILNSKPKFFTESDFAIFLIIGIILLTFDFFLRAFIFRYYT